MKHLALVPLIGGMAIGAEQVLGHPPEAVLSYSTFDANDAYYMGYLAKRGFDIKRYDIESDDIPSFKEVDIITSVCPCSGLSSANRNAGSGCQQNQWMLKSSQYALSQIKPRVLIGENASTLMGTRGIGVVSELRDIARAAGYKLQLVKTNTSYHGIPQGRERSFFIFWRDGGPYRLKQSYTPSPVPWWDFLESFGSDDTILKRDVSMDWLMNEVKTVGKFDDDSLKSLLLFHKTSIHGLLVYQRSDIWDEISRRHEDSEDKVIATALRRFNSILNNLKAKKEKGGSNKFYDSSYFYRQGPNFGSVMFRTRLQVLHPFKHRTITDREAMRLMGLPEDMDPPRDSNAIAQNVPSCTAAWIVRECVDVLNGERAVIDGVVNGDGIFRWNNKNDKVATAIGEPILL